MKRSRGYLAETRRPVYSAALVFPFLCVYHAGTILVGGTHINGADALIIRILGALGVFSVYASALVLAAALAAWQWRTRAPGRIRPRLLALSLLESTCFALVLLAAFGWLGPRLPLALSDPAPGLRDFILYCGAGVYEEFLFRWILLGALIWLFRRILPGGNTAATAAAALSAALIFAAFHYVGPGGIPLTPGSFALRAVGGLYFGLIFIMRGFGLAAASHAIYDIVLGIVAQ
ncbi:MAG: CPBP family intramembrane metalloprotease [Acidobacteria bacterium]|nr:CPBP family intramembrane metalloprotease [Acidobacteriota bacterium]